jgi:hypothetical protein
MTTPIDMPTPTDPDPTRTDPTDPLPPEEFSSWQSALEQSLLRPAQVAVLQTMVDEGHAKALEDAASILDLQETIIHPPEHMYGN